MSVEAELGQLCVDLIEPDVDDELDELASELVDLAIFWDVWLTYFMFYLRASEMN